MSESLGGLVCRGGGYMDFEFRTEKRSGGTEQRSRRHVLENLGFHINVDSKHPNILAMKGMRRDTLDASKPGVSLFRPPSHEALLGRAAAIEEKSKTRRTTTEKEGPLKCVRKEGSVDDRSVDGEYSNDAEEPAGDGCDQEVGEDPRLV